MNIRLLATVLVCGLACTAMCTDLRVLRAEVRGVGSTSVWLRIRNEGSDIPGLTSSAFTLLVNGAPTAIESVAIEPEPRSEDALAVMFVVDASGSTRGLTIETAKLAIRGFLERLRSNDIVGLVRAGSTPTVLLEPTSDKGQASSSLEDISVGGRSALFDALSSAVSALAKVQALRRAVVLVSDGKENSSKDSLADVEQAAKKQAVELHALLVGTAEPGQWHDLCDQTGGSFTGLDNESRLASAFEHLARELTAVYRVSFVLPDTVSQTASVELAVADRTDHVATKFSLAIPDKLVTKERARNANRSPAILIILGLVVLNAVLAVVLLRRGRNRGDRGVQHP